MEASTIPQAWPVPDEAGDVLMALHMPATDTITAYATLAAVVVALALAVAPALGRWWIRPKLSLGVGSIEPYLHAVHPKGLEPDEILVRVRVDNLGRTTARNVRVTLVGWFIAEVEGYDWVRAGIDPMVLGWVSDPSAVTAIPRGGYDLATFAKWVRGGPSRVRLTPADDRTDHSFDMESMKQDVEHVVEIGVSADNAASVRGYVSFTPSYKYWISNVRLRDAPTGPTLEGGLLGLFSGVAQEDDSS